MKLLIRFRVLRKKAVIPVFFPHFVRKGSFSSSRRFTSIRWHWKQTNWLPTKIAAWEITLWPIGVGLVTTIRHPHRGQFGVDLINSLLRFPLFILLQYMNILGNVKRYFSAVCNFTNFTNASQTSPSKWIVLMGPHPFSVVRMML